MTGKKSKKTLAVALPLAAVGIVAFFVLAVRHVMRVERGAPLPQAADLVLLGLDKKAFFLDEAYVMSIDTMVQGDYPVTLHALGSDRRAVLRVADTKAPTADLHGRVGILGRSEYVPSDFLSNVCDVTDAAARFTRALDLERHGSQTVRIVLCDSFGNEARHRTRLRLLRLRDPLQFEIGVAPDPLPIGALFDERELDGIPMEFLKEPDMSSLSEQEVRLLLDGREYTLTVEVADTIAPRAKVKDLDGWVGQTIEAKEFLEDVQDATKLTARYVKEPNMNKKGRQTVEIELIDQAGNTTPFKAKLTLREDKGPPELHGVKDITVERFGTVAYRKGVTVTDDSGQATFTVDSAAVDTNTPGTYAVTYIAKDPVGNETRQTITVTVSGVTEKEVADLVDPVLAKIIAEDMTDEEKAAAVHQWIHQNIGYNNTGDKSSVLDGAYNAMKLLRGDCYTFYAISKYMLSHLEIDSIDIHRIEGTPTRHYWLLLNFGEGWHHFDACPVRSSVPRPKDGMMMTDSEAQSFAVAFHHPDYYHYDPETLPEGVFVVE